MPEFTRIEPDAAAELLANWDIVPETLEPLEGGIASTTYCVNGAWVFAVLDRLDLPGGRGLAGFLRHLADTSLPTPPLRLTRDGADHVVWRDRVVLVRAFWPADVVSPLPGKWLPAAGRLLASIHATPPLPVSPVDDIGFAVDWRPVLTGRDEAPLAAAIEGAEARFDHAACNALPRGLVHGDFFDDNLLIRPDGTLGVIDWEFGCVDAFVLDIAMAVVGVCRTGANLDPARLREFLSAYEDVRSLTAEERAMLRPAVMFCAARVAFYRDYIDRVLAPGQDLHKDWREITAFMEALPDRLDP